MAQFDTADLEDLLPLFMLAKLDASGTLDELKAAKAISNVVDRHVAKALRDERAERHRESMSRVYPG